MKNNQFVLWFEQVDKHDVGIVGGKGANLGEMTNAHFPIPYGFITTSHAYFTFIKEADLMPKMREFFSVVNYENPHELQQVSQHVQRLILNAPMPKAIEKTILEYYRHMFEKEQEYMVGKKGFFHRAKSAFMGVPTVAVRSSATAEDLPGASFAGQQETYLNVKGEDQLLRKVKECWASLFTERAIYYRNSQGFDHFKVGLAAVVQRMVASEKSGIAFSVDPISGDRTRIVIEAIYGLGEYIVQGKVTPDHYEVDKRSFEIIEKQPKRQTLKYVRSGRGNKEVKLSSKEGSHLKLSDQEIIKVAMAVKDIETHYYFPQDIEWAIEKNHVFIVQSRPITTLTKAQEQMDGDEKDVAATPAATAIVMPKERPVVVGAPASPGIAVGPVQIIRSPKEIDKIHKGDILVAPQTNPDYVPAMKKASAIVTEKGGRTSHAAIVSRELGIPAVVGAEGATELLKSGQIVSVNGQTGEVFKGSVLSPSHIHHEVAGTKHPHTKTKVYVNLAEPEEAVHVSKMDVDGVGLLRAEFMIAGLGTHPKVYIHKGTQSEFIGHLKKNLLTFTKAFNPRPIIYRATDFKTNEYRHLKGGEKYEPEEENPMLGYRGASRYIQDPEVFAMELEALRQLWEDGYENIHLMIPFVRRPWELIKIKEMVQQAGLLDMKGFRLLIMVEVPAAALELESFLKIGVDGVSIGTNDLTMMLLGVDRDNEKVAPIYDERSAPVVAMLEHIVKTCTAYGVTSSICGQAASDYPEIVEKLVSLGITSVSINPDVVDKTRKQIYDIERSLRGTVV